MSCFGSLVLRFSYLAVASGIICSVSVRFELIKRTEVCMVWYVLLFVRGVQLLMFRWLFFREWVVPSLGV